MRSPARKELPLNASEDKVAFLLVALDCEVRLLLPPFVRQFLSKAPFHPFQVSSAIWENILAFCAIWYKAHGRDLSVAELQACFRLRPTSRTSGIYYPYNTRKRTLRKEVGL